MEGDGVRVSVADGTIVAGDLVELSSTVFRITRRGGVLALNEDEIRAVELRDSVENGVWWGVGAGLGTFFALCAQGRTLECVAYLHNAGMIWAGIGAFVGWSIDVGTRELLYRAPDTVRLNVTPMASPHGVGVQMAVGW